MTQTAEPSVAKPKAARTHTAYHVLQAVTDPDKGTVYQLAARDVEAANANQAIRAHVNKLHADKHKADGTFVAVPARSWVETAVKVETTTTVKLA